jgi:glyceraldehyde 3-phosphate dehydrogenase
MSVRVGINGFGRIGRMVFRAALKHPDIEVAAINDLTDAPTMAHLLTYDSVHGKLDHAIRAENDALMVDDRRIAYSAIKDPAQLPWQDLGIDIALECTGLFRDRESAARHLAAGARKVIISAPAKEPDTTIVMGVNHSSYDPKQHHVISNASCTTNCLSPVAKVILDNFGITSGLMTTIHAYTGDQRLLDFPHKDLRRARAAALSMIPTTTGAAKAVALVLPELAGKLNGLAIRVPTPNVSIVDIVLTIEKTGVTVSDVNAALQTAAEGELQGILGFSKLPLVSTDYNGCPLSSIVDAQTTYAVGQMVKVLAWYDNESGYSHRMVDLTALVGSML